MQPLDASAVAANKPFEPATKKKKNHFWKAIALIAAAILIAAVAAICYLLYTYVDGERQYDELAQYMRINDSETSMSAEDAQSPITLASFSVDWDALRAINSDVVAWVYVPDTVINYPVVWREGDDAYYMNHNFGRNSVGAFGAEYGAISLASINSPDWTDRVSFLSGHHMANGTMFAAFAHFVHDDIFNSHRTIYLLTPQGNFKLNTFAVNKIIATSQDTIVSKFPTTEEYRAYIQKHINESLVTPNPPAPGADEIEQAMMFYTCNEPDNRYRICVYANVEEFLPAGSDVALGNALISDEDIGNVGAAIGERLL